jgi:hypothetical protein
MNWMVPRLALAAAVLLACGPASAQIGRNYDVHPMNFDLWCQDTAKIDPDRCDKRLPEDNDAFEAYRAKIDAYEIPYLREKNKDARIELNILHNDPLDRSATSVVQTQGEQGGSQTPVRPDAVP